MIAEIPSLRQLERKRRLGKRRAQLVCLLPILIGLACTLYFLWRFPFNDNYYFIYFFCLFLTICFTFIVYTCLKGDSSTEFKEIIIPYLLKSEKLRFYHRPEKFLEQAIFEDAMFFIKPDVYKGEDLIDGWYGKLFIGMSFITAQEIVRKSSRNTDGSTKSSTSYRIIFQGILLQIDNLKPISGTVCLHSGGGLSRGQKVLLEDPKFQKQWAVYASDQIDARYILTPTMMEKILQVGQRFQNIKLSFIGDKMYLAIKYSDNPFNPKDHMPLHDLQQIEEIRSNLRAILEILDLLGLADASNSGYPSIRKEPQHERNNFV